MRQFLHRQGTSALPEASLPRLHADSAERGQKPPRHDSTAAAAAHRRGSPGPRPDRSRGCSAAAAAAAGAASSCPADSAAARSPARSKGKGRRDYYFAASRKEEAPALRFSSGSQPVRLALGPVAEDTDPESRWPWEQEVGPAPLVQPKAGSRVRRAISFGEAAAIV